MVIVDSSVLIDFVNDGVSPQSDWLNFRLGNEELGITTLILTEVLQGIRSERRFDEVAQILSQFEVYEDCDSDLAIQAARNYRTLRGLGITVRNTVDTLVATFCIENVYFLLHRDSDFDGFAQHLGLRVIDPARSTPN
jgi:predicted nucleic acid-binding protein